MRYSSNSANTTTVVDTVVESSISNDPTLSWHAKYQNCDAIPELSKMLIESSTIDGLTEATSEAIFDDLSGSEGVSHCTSPSLEAFHLNHPLSKCQSQKDLLPALKTALLQQQQQETKEEQHQHNEEDEQPSFLKLVMEALYDSSSTLSLVDEDCVGGTYFLKKNNKNIAVIKPNIEEAGSRYNPKGYSNEHSCTKMGFTPGSGCTREAFAFKIAKNLTNIPETHVIDIPSEILYKNNPKTLKRAPKTVKISVQQYIPDTFQSWDFGPISYDVHDAHSIGILDLRLLNCDRHGGNILVKEDEVGRKRLYPIDHGYTLPTCVADLDFEWQLWPQSKMPFSLDLIEKVRAIDLDAEVQIALESGIESTAIELFKVSTVVLKVGVELGMNLYELASFFRRERINEESGLERLYSKCRRSLDHHENPGEMDFDLLESEANKVLSGDWKILLS